MVKQQSVVAYESREQQILIVIHKEKTGVGIISAVCSFIEVLIYMNKTVSGRLWKL